MSICEGPSFGAESVSLSKSNTILFFLLMRGDVIGCSGAVTRIWDLDKRLLTTVLLSLIFSVSKSQLLSEDELLSSRISEIRPKGNATLEGVTNSLFASG